MAQANDILLHRSTTTATPTIIYGEPAWTDLAGAEATILWVGDAGATALEVGGGKYTQAAGFSIKAKTDTGTGYIGDLTFPVSTMLGRESTGDLKAMSVAQVLSTLGITAGAAPDQNIFDSVSTDNTDIEYTWVGGGSGAEGEVTVSSTTTDLTLVASGAVVLDYDNTNKAILIDVSGLGSGDVSSTGTGFADGELVIYHDGTGDVIKTSNTTVADLYAFGAITTDGSTATADAAGDSLAFTGGTGLTTSGTTGAAAAISVALDNTAVTPASYGTATQVGSFTVDAQGRLTDASNTAIAIPSSQITDVASIAMLDEAEIVLAGWTFGDGSAMNFSVAANATLSVQTPTSDAHAATKAYVDTRAAGLDPKGSVRCATTADTAGTYNSTGGTSGTGQFTAMSNANIDGVVLAQGDKVLMKDQSPGDENGIWVITTLGTGANGVWDRATNFDEDAEVTTGAYCFVEEGTVSKSVGYILSTANPITIGTASGTALTFDVFTRAADYTAGSGIDITTNTISVNVDSVTTYVNGSDQVAVKDSGTADEVMVSTGSGSGTWGAINLASTDAVGATILGVGNGGTGVSTLTQYGVVLGNAGNDLQVTAQGADGYILRANGAANPTWTNTIDGGTF